jgi:hypothetical protein
MILVLGFPYYKTRYSADEDVFLHSAPANFGANKYKQVQLCSCECDHLLEVTFLETSRTQIHNAKGRRKAPHFNHRERTEV